MTAWTDLVKKIWEENKNKAGFKFKNALQLAKKQYKGNKTMKKKGGMCTSSKSIADTAAIVGGQDNTAELAVEGQNVTTSVQNSEMDGDDKMVNTSSSELLGGKKSNRKTKKEKGGKRKSKKDEEKKGGEIDNTKGGTPYFK